VDHIILRIKACRDAHILLSESLEMGANTYEVALGILSNTMTVIREGPYGANVATADTPGILDCNQFKFVLSLILCVQCFSFIEFVLHVELSLILKYTVSTQYCVKCFSFIEFVLHVELSLIVLSTV